MTLSVGDFIAQRTRWGYTERHDLELATQEIERLGLIDWFKHLKIDDFRFKPGFVDQFWKNCSSDVRDQLWADSGCSYSFLIQSLHYYYTTRDQDWVCAFDTNRAHKPTIAV